MTHCCKVKQYLFELVFHISPYTLFSEILASVLILGLNSLLRFVLILKYNNIFKLQYPMDPESSLYIMSALAHQKYILSDGSFREIKHNTVPRNLFFNKRSGAVVMSPDSEGLGAAVVVGVGSSLTQPSGISYFSLYTFF